MEKSLFAEMPEEKPKGKAEKSMLDSLLGESKSKKPGKAPDLLKEKEPANELPDIFSTLEDEQDDEPAIFSAFDEEEKQDRQEGQHHDDFYRTQAKSLQLIVDMVASGGASYISGEPSKIYRMDEDQKEDYINSCVEYMKSSNFRVSPGWAFFGVNVSILALIFYKATEDKKAKEAAKRAKEAAKRAKEAEEKFKRGEATETDFMNAVEHKEEEEQRTRFEVDAKGFYERNLKGEYVQQKYRPVQTGRAPAKVLNMTEELKKQGKSQGEINAYFRKEFYGIED